MPKLLNQNWVYDDDNAIHARKAHDVLRLAKAQRKGRKWKHIKINDMPYTIKEVEAEDGQYMYGK
jgi:hypothetical protein